MVRRLLILSLLLEGCGAPKCADCTTSELCDENTGRCVYAGPTGGGGGAVGGGGGAVGGGGGTGGGGATGGGGSGNLWTSTDAGSADGGACTDTWSSYAGGWFSAACSGCHGSTWDYPAVSSSADLVACVVASGAMPPGGASQADRDRVEAWFRCGLPR